jgi:hypothetical protein
MKLSSLKKVCESGPSALLIEKFDRVSFVVFYDTFLYMHYYVKKAKSSIERSQNSSNKKIKVIYIP